jgi:hypothetical protein
MVMCKGRPTAIFDARNKEHRDDYRVFLETQSLGKTKYRYFPTGSGSVLDDMQKGIAEYCSHLEFNT